MVSGSICQVIDLKSMKESLENSSDRIPLLVLVHICRNLLLHGDSLANYYNFIHWKTSGGIGTELKK